MASATRRVLVGHKDVPKKALNLLAESCEIVFPDGDPPTREQILKAARQAAAQPGGLSAIFWWGKVRFDAEVLDAAGPSLRVATTMSAGQDQVDIAELRRRGIALGNTSRVLDSAVADVAVGLLISASRRFHEGRKIIESGEWLAGGRKKGDISNPLWMSGYNIENRTVGILGFGGIGSAIARRLKGFDIARILYSGRTDKPYAKELGAERVPFPELLRLSDIVIAACPLTPETTRIFNAEAFKQMKKEAVFVNVGRGGLVDQAALVNALKTGEIFAAGLDVMTPEPLPPDDPLLQLPNAVVIPHLGSATQETREAMAVLAARNILAGLSGQPLPSQVL